MTRHDVTIPVGGAELAAWHYPGRGDAAPVVVLAHGLAGVRQMRLDAFAERFQAAGYACLVFDYRGFGDSGGEPRQVIDVRAQLEDWRAAVAHARELPGVDPERVVLWGSSFSGGHVLEVAADDPRVAAVVSQCAFTNGLSSGLAMSPRTTARLAPYVARDLVRAVRGGEPVRVPAAGPPHSAALMTAADALPGYAALREATGLADLRDDVAARFGLGILGYRPGRRAAAIDAPLLAVLCRHDSVAPSGRSRRHFARAPQVELHEVDHGHFDIYLGEAFEEVVALELGFLARHVPVG